MKVYVFSIARPPFLFASMQYCTQSRENAPEESLSEWRWRGMFMYPSTVYLVALRR